jgi:hypothetical protein
MSKGTNVTIKRFHVVKHLLFIPEQNSEVLTTVIYVIKRKYFRRFAGNCWTRQSRVQHSNESQIFISSIHYFLVDCNKNTRKNFHSIIKVTFGP